MSDWWNIFGSESESSEECERPRKKHNRRKHHRKPKKEECQKKCKDDDVCERVKSYTRVKLPIRVLVLKPRCANGSCDHGDSSEEVCTEENMCANIKIPIVTEIRRSSCYGCN